MLTALAPAVRAQIPQDMSAGTRVRVFVADPGLVFVGTLLATRADTMSLRADPRADTVHVALARITRVDVSRGMVTRGSKGRRIGALVGAFAGAAIVIAKCHAETCQPEETDYTFPAALLGAAAGAGAGLIIGSVLYSGSAERWEEVPRAGWHVSVACPGAGRVGLAASLSL